MPAVTIDSGLLEEAVTHAVRSGGVNRRTLQHALRVDAGTTALVVGRLQQLGILTPGLGRPATCVAWQSGQDTLAWALRTIREAHRDA